MIASWSDWFMSQNGLGAKEPWDPEHNPHQLIRAEVSDLYKAMTKIRALENKLKQEGLNTGTTNADWNLLNSLKREVGIPVEFAGDAKAQTAGEGNIAAKSLTAFS